MSLEDDGAKLDQRREAKPPSPAAESSLKPCSLSDAELQEQYRKEYLEQLRRRSCPGCGEGDAFFEIDESPTSLTVGMSQARSALRRSP